MHGTQAKKKRLAWYDFCADTCFFDLSAATAAAMTNPMDLIKTKGQIEARDPSTGTGQRPSVRGLLGTVLREEGVRGLWRGTVPGATRASILTASQLVTYSEMKVRERERERAWCARRLRRVGADSTLFFRRRMCCVTWMMVCWPTCAPAW